MKSKDISDIVKGGIRSVAASVPIVSSFSQAWSEIESGLHERRVDGFFRQIQADIQSVADQLKMHEEQIKKQGDFLQVVERIVDKVRRETSEMKARRYSLLLKNMLLFDPPMTTGEKMDAIESLDKLTDEDMLILVGFNQRNTLRVDSLVSENGFGFSTIGSKQPGGVNLIQMSRTIASLSKLQARGLIAESVEAGGAYGWSGDRQHWYNQWKTKSFEMLPHGHAFVKLLKEGN